MIPREWKCSSSILSSNNRVRGHAPQRLKLECGDIGRRAALAISVSSDSLLLCWVAGQLPDTGQLRGLGDFCRLAASMYPKLPAPAG